MGDAIHDNVGHLQVARPQLAAGYVTGSADIKWTAADWALFPGIPHVTIDQGFTGSPVPSAIVRDVEPGAWQPFSAVNRNGWTAARPTIYCDRNDLSREGGVLGCGWKGDLWLAWPGWNGEPLPTAPGCTYVAVQNQPNVGNAYDLSVVLDDNWPDLAPTPPAPVSGKAADMIVIQVTTPAGIKFHDGGTGTRTYLYPPLEHIVDVPSNTAFARCCRCRCRGSSTSASAALARLRQPAAKPSITPANTSARCVGVDTALARGEVRRRRPSTAARYPCRLPYFLVTAGHHHTRHHHHRHPLQGGTLRRLRDSHCHRRWQFLLNSRPPRREPAHLPHRQADPRRPASHAHAHHSHPYARHQPRYRPHHHPGSCCSSDQPGREPAAAVVAARPVPEAARHQPLTTPATTRHNHAAAKPSSPSTTSRPAAATREPSSSAIGRRRNSHPA